MADRPDLRQIAVDIGAALEGYDRDALLQMLTYVFKEYVVEGAPPVLVSQVDGIEALDGLSFPELIEQLQARLDLPELEQFAVRDNTVHVRVGGVMTPITPPTGRRPGPAPAPIASGERTTATSDGPTETSDNASRATRDEAIARGRGDLVGGSRGVVMAPPARGGVSVNSRPAASAAPAPASSEPKPPETSEPEAPEKDAPGDDDASVRFSLLELD